MSVLALPRSWGRTKPPPGTQINFGHPLARGLVDVVVFNEQAGQPRELITGEQLAVASGTPTWAGGGRNYVATADDSLTNTARRALLGPMTQMCGYITRSVAAQQQLPNFRTGALTNSPWGMTYGAGQMYFLWGSAGSFGLATGDQNPATDTFIVQAGVRDAANNGQLWYQGRPIGTPQVSGVTATNSGNPMYFSTYDGVNEPGTFTLFFHYLWNRALQPSELAWLYREPYAIFNPPGRWSRWAPSVAAASTNIKTIDSLALASVKTVDSLAIASLKTWNGLARVIATGPPITPTLAWWDPSDAATITKVTNSVTQMTDKSGNSHTLTCPGSTPPTIGLTLLNGLDIIDYSGCDRGLETAANITQAMPVTIIGVVKLLSGSPSTNQHWQSSTGGPISYEGGGNWSMYNGSVLDSGVACDTNSHVISALYNGASSTMRKDGSQIVSGNPGTGNWSSNVIGLGVAAGGSVNRWPGLVGEVLIYSSALSTGDQAAAEAYLKAKWGTP